jgi:hypothetical protein
VVRASREEVSLHRDGLQNRRRCPKRADRRELDARIVAPTVVQLRHLFPRNRSKFPCSIRAESSYFRLPDGPVELLLHVGLSPRVDAVSPCREVELSLAVSHVEQRRCLILAWRGTRFTSQHRCAPAGPAALGPCRSSGFNTPRKSRRPRKRSDLIALFEVPRIRAVFSMECSSRL